MSHLTCADFAISTESAISYSHDTPVKDSEAKGTLLSPDQGSLSSCTAETRAARLLVLWVSLAAILALANALVWLHHPFTYEHGWGSSHQALMARAFVQHGVVALGGVPVQNNPPIGPVPDAYIHWPPLPPILLSFVFQIFGESEASGHGLMIAIFLANCLALYALARTCWDTRVALFTVFGALLIPVSVKYSVLITPQPFGILGSLLALLGFIKAKESSRTHRGWMWFGGAALTFGALSSWEPLLLPPSLLAIALWRRDRQQLRLALLYCVTAAASFSIMMTIYVLKAPGLVADLWHTFLLRANLTDFQATGLNVYTVVNETHYADETMSLVSTLWLYVSNSLTLITIAPLLALGWVFASGWRNRHCVAGVNAATLFIGLLGPWLIWFTLVSNQAARHDFMLLLGVPALSTALGLSAVRLMEAASRAPAKNRQRALHWLVLGMLPVAMTFPALMSIRTRLQNPPEEDKRFYSYGLDIKGATGKGAVVLTPAATIIPVYYSERHMIRGIADDSYVEKVVPLLSRTFPGAPLYLALQPDGLKDFSQSLKRYPVVKQTQDMILLSITSIGDPEQRLALHTPVE